MIILKINKIKWWWIAGLAVILLAAYFGVKWWNRDVVTIKTAAVVTGPIEAVISASGIVDAPVYELGTKLGGKVVSLMVKEGQRVYKGETLAELDDTTRIVSPNLGIVAKINVDPGETVVPGTAAIVVVNYSRSWIEAQIDEIDIGDVKLGDRVKIASDVYPGKVFDGEIYWISPLAELRKVGGRIKLDEESYVFFCKIRFLGKHDELKVNMSVNVDIVTKRKENAVIVPREAIVAKNDSSVVFVVKNDRVYQQPLEIGIRSYTSVEALAGVSAGDILALSNGDKLKDKGRIKIER